MTAPPDSGCALPRSREQIDNPDCQTARQPAQTGAAGNKGALMRPCYLSGAGYAVVPSSPGHLLARIGQAQRALPRGWSAGRRHIVVCALRAQRPLRRARAARRSIAAFSFRRQAALSARLLAFLTGFPDRPAQPTTVSELLAGTPSGPWRSPGAGTTFI